MHHEESQDHDNEFIKKVRRWPQYDPDLCKSLFDPPVLPMLIQYTGWTFLSRRVCVHLEHPAGIAAKLRTTDDRGIENPCPLSQRPYSGGNPRISTVAWPASDNYTGTGHPVFESRYRVILRIPRHAQKTVVEPICSRLYR